MTDERLLTELADCHNDRSGWWGSWTTFLYGLVLGLDAKRVIEVGVWKGGSTKAFLLALKVTGGHLWSIDIEDRSANIPEDLRSRWTQIVKPSEEVTPTFHADYFSNDRMGLADLVMIDAVHTYEAVSRELRDLAPLVRAGGLMLADDVAPSMFPGVSQAWDEWVGRENFLWHHRIPYGHPQTQPGGSARELGIAMVGPP